MTSKAFKTLEQHAEQPTARRIAMDARRSGPETTMWAQRGGNELSRTLPEDGHVWLFRISSGVDSGEEGLARDTKLRFEARKVDHAVRCNRVLQRRARGESVDPATHFRPRNTFTPKWPVQSRTRFQETKNALTSPPPFDCRFIKAARDETSSTFSKRRNPGRGFRNLPTFGCFPVGSVEAPNLGALRIPELQDV